MTVISPGVLADVHFMLPIEIPFVGGLVPGADIQCMNCQQAKTKPAGK